MNPIVEFWFDRDLRMIIVTDPMLEFEFRTLQASELEPGESYFLPPGDWFLKALIHLKGRAKNKDDAVSLFNDSIYIERPGTVEFEFGTLKAQSRGGLLPSTWLPLIFNPAFKISPWFYIPPPGRPQSEKGNFVIIFYDSNYVFFLWETRCTNENGSKRSMMPVFRRNTQRQILGC